MVRCVSSLLPALNCTHTDLHLWSVRDPASASQWQKQTIKILYKCFYKIKPLVGPTTCTIMKLLCYIEKTNCGENKEISSLWTGKFDYVIIFVGENFRYPAKISPLLPDEVFPNKVTPTLPYLLTFV